MKKATKRKKKQPATTAFTVETLSQAIQAAAGEKKKNAIKYCASGCLPVVDPGLVVDGVGAIEFPLQGSAEALVGRCHQAPYGKGTETLYDMSVRTTFELDPANFQLSDDWKAAITNATKDVAVELGLPAEQLEAHLYKLLVYETGGFFLPHRDSEKHDGMVASLIVVLPNSFGGGTLVVEHGDDRQVFKFTQAARAKVPCYAAFYADCEHEVKQVTRGRRVCLAYNLVLKPQPRKRVAAQPVNLGQLTKAIESWVKKAEGKPLVFALEHEYTERGLSLDLLKGADRELADLIVPAAESANCLAHFAKVTRHLSQGADDGSYDHGRSRRYGGSRYARPAKPEYSIYETYEDELSGSGWRALDGTKRPWKEITLSVEAVVSAIPVDEWKVDSEEYEGYTGNAGNTLDRWYRRSAIVLWHRKKHFDLMASNGPQTSVPAFCSLASKLAKTPKSRFAAAHQDCLQFGRAILSRWPRCQFLTTRTAEEATQFKAFLQAILSLHDAETITQLLSTLALRDMTRPLQSVIVAAGREFGWQTFAGPLKALLDRKADPHSRDDIPQRDFEWLAAICIDDQEDPRKTKLVADLCSEVVKRFCQPPTDPRRRSDAENSVPFLLQALLATERSSDLATVIQLLQSAPVRFPIDTCQAPALISVIPWAQQHLGFIPTPLSSWQAAVRQQLESVTAQAPPLPTDWRRPATFDCHCRDCTALKTFLDSPDFKIGTIAASKRGRHHLYTIVSGAKLDVTHTVNRQTSPETVIFTKTQASFDRALKQFETDSELLNQLSQFEAT